MTLIVDDQHLGTSEASWRASERLSRLGPLPNVTQSRAVIVSPHPDDEVLGVGGLLLSMECTDVHIVAVTDGEASHPDGAIEAGRLRMLRAEESAAALRRLGRGDVSVSRLRLPDGAVSEYSDQLVRHLSQAMGPGDLCVAPWRHDGHPDHDACGRVAAEVTGAMGAQLLEYLVWAWHWLEPDDPRLPWEHGAVLRLSRRQGARKRWATHAFASQIRPLGGEPDASAVLPPTVLRRFWRPFEVFIDRRGQ